MNKWVHSVLLKLVSYLLRQMKARDVKWLYFPLYVCMSCVQEKHDMTHQKLAMCAPHISKDKGNDCINHTQCIQPWEYTWFQTIRKLLPHPKHLMVLQFWQMENRIVKIDTNQIVQGCGRKVKAKALGSGGRCRIKNIQKRKYKQIGNTFNLESL